MNAYLILGGIGALAILVILVMRKVEKFRLVSS